MMLLFHWLALVQLTVNSKHAQRERPQKSRPNTWDSDDDFLSSNKAILLTVDSCHSNLGQWPAPLPPPGLRPRPVCPATHLARSGPTIPPIVFLSHE